MSFTDSHKDRLLEVQNKLLEATTELVAIMEEVEGKELDTILGLIEKLDNVDITLGNIAG